MVSFAVDHRCLVGFYDGHFVHAVYLLGPLDSSVQNCRRDGEVGNVDSIRRRFLT